MILESRAATLNKKVKLMGKKKNKKDKDVKENIKQEIDDSSILAYRDEKEDFIFDDDKIIKNLHSSVGIFKGHYYFGVLVPKKVKSEKVINKKTYRKEFQRPTLLIILDDHTWFEVDEEFEEKNNVKFSDYPVTNSMWSLKEIERYITWQGSLVDKFKVLEPKEMFEKVKAQYKKYCYFQDEEWYDINALWDIGTYFFPLFKAYPYMEARGLKGTGKSKVLVVSRLITLNATPLFTNPTPSTIFRLVDKNKPTFYIDECEKLISNYKKGAKEVDDVIQFLNSGWDNNGYVPRVEKNEFGKFEIKNFSTYCPKRLASIRGLDELPATADRTITQIMIRAPKEDKRGDLNPEDDLDFSEIRNTLYPFALKYWNEVLLRYGVGIGEIEKKFNLSNRDWQIWKPLLCIAQLVDGKYQGEGELFNKVGKFAEKLTEIKETMSLEEGSIDFKILDSLWRIIKHSDSDKKIEITTSGIRNNIEILEEKEKRPSHSYIGRFINKIGFEKFRKRTGSKGVYYLLSKNDVEFILKTQNLLTLVTLVTPEEEVIDDKDIT